MWKFLKMTVAEDGITTEEVLVVVLAEVVQAVIEVQHQEEKVVLLQEEKADLEVTEVQLLEKVVLAEEANQEAQLLQEQAVSLIDLQDHQRLQDVMTVHQKDQQDVLKVLAMRQEKKDQEEANTFC